MYSIKINGLSKGFFAGQKGFRQGDQLSPYLFILCMDIFSLLLNRAVNNGRIEYHPKCSKIGLSHFCFADDLMIFAAATYSSLKGDKEVFNEFYSLSGVQVSYMKS